MDDLNSAQIRREGDPAFGTDTEKDNSADSPSAETTTTEGDANTGAANNQKKETDTPFHEHPRWKEREDEWNNRFNSQESRHQEDLKKIREDFTTARKANSDEVKIPSWFGGTQQQWNDYRADQETALSQAEARAEERAVQKLSSMREQEEKRVTEATAYLHSELAAIEKDKTLNPSSEKVNAEKLLKIVMDRKLVDTEGRWNYRAGWEIMRAQTAAAAPQNNATDRKIIAGATNTETRGEPKTAPFKTSKDFKTNRPW